MTKKNALIGTAALELGAGLPVVLAPQFFAAVASLSLTPDGLIMTRLFGLAVCVLGVIAWLVRDVSPPLGTSLQRSFAAYHLLATGFLSFLLLTGGLEPFPLVVAPVLHAVLGIGLLLGR